MVEALIHGGIANQAKVQLEWIDAELIEQQKALRPSSRMSMALARRIWETRQRRQN